MRKFLLLFIIAASALACLRAGGISSGLNFASHEAMKEARTSLQLNDGKAFRFPKGFTLDFELRFRTELHNYGYVFRIIANDTVSFDLVSNYTDGRKSLNFIEGNRAFAPFSSKALEEYPKGSWAKVRLKVAPEDRAITIAFNGETLTMPYPYEGLSRYGFWFGYCDHPDFTSYDVPPMAVRNVRLTDENGKTQAYWPLREHALTEAYDSVARCPAKACNPVWEIDKHARWEKRAGFTAGHYAQAAFNEQDGTLYFADQRQVLALRPGCSRLDTLSATGGNPYYSSSNQMIYYPPSGELWSYDFDGPRISRFNFATRQWSQANQDTKNPGHSHHNAFVCPEDSCLYVFGGYGNYTYKNDFLRLRPDETPWEKVEMTPPVPPRYLSAAGMKDAQNVLIFGGYGHPSGLQDLGAYNYYDLYEANLSTRHARKLWALDKPQKPFAVGNAIVIDSAANTFYTLCFPNNQGNSHIVLESFRISDGQSKALADTIPYRFEDINAYSSLYCDKKNDMLYAVTIFHEKQQSQIAVYSLPYPPLAAADTLQQAATPFPAWGIATGAAVFMAIGACTFVFLAKRKSKGKTLVPDAIAIDNKEYTPRPVPKRSAILFLGGFQVWDKDGNDITRLFTKTLRHTLMLIILYTQRNGKGISSSTLCEILWPDKNEESAQNNRRVTIRKLKVLLEKLEGIELANTNSYWTTQCRAPFFCDYYAVFSSLEELHRQTEIQINKLHDLIHLVGTGMPLPFVSQEWADSFKSDYANHVQDALWSIVQNGNLSDFKLLIKIADAIFLFDPTDENAIRLKCSVLAKNGKTGLAKNAYDLFCSEYKQLLGTTYNKSFNDVCNPSNP